MEAVFHVKAKDPPKRQCINREVLCCDIWCFHQSMSMSLDKDHWELVEMVEKYGFSNYLYVDVSPKLSTLACLKTFFDETDRTH